MSVTPFIFLAALVVALAAFTVFLTKRVRYLLLGQPEVRSDQLGRRASGFVVYVFGQKKLFKERVGILHFFIFWGFIVVAFGALQIIGEGLSEAFSLPLLGDWPGVLPPAGPVHRPGDRGGHRRRVHPLRRAPRALSRRASKRASSWRSSSASCVAGLLYSGLTYARAPSSSHSLAPLTKAVAGAAQGAGWSEGALQTAAWVFWWLHVLFMLAFLVYIPVSKHLHLLACPVNEFFRNLKPAGAQIKPLDLEDEEVEEFGVSRIEGFTRWQLLDLYACTECGRCQDHCPAHLSGKTLSPRTLMTKLRHHLDERGPALMRAGGAGGQASVRRRLPGQHDRRRDL